jgi:hypothetical protein
MAGSSNAVLKALGRWERKGLLSGESVAALREEVEEETRAATGRMAQFALAATGGAVLIIAGATFLAWVWPGMGYASQSLTLGIVGIMILALGVRLFGPPSLIPVSYLLQLSAPVLILLALAYSENSWPDRTPGGVVAGILGLVVGGGVVRYALKRDPVLGALQAVFSFLFFFLFLDRALGLGIEASLWVMDGMGLLGLAWLGFRLRDPVAPEWTLNTFVAFLYVSLFLVMVSAEILWDLDSTMVIPGDLWLLTVTGISVWALQEGVPLHLQRDWYQRQLAYCLLLAVPFSFMTVLDAMRLGANTAAATLTVIGSLGLWYGIRRGFRAVLVTSCLVLLIAAWYYGVEKAGALGAVLALGGMAAILFFVAARLAPSKAASGSGIAGGGGR